MAFLGPDALPVFEAAGYRGSTKRRYLPRSPRPRFFATGRISRGVGRGRVNSGSWRGAWPRKSSAKRPSGAGSGSMSLMLALITSPFRASSAPTVTFRLPASRSPAGPFQQRSIITKRKPSFSASVRGAPTGSSGPVDSVETGVKPETSHVRVVGVESQSMIGTSPTSSRLS